MKFLFLIVASFVVVRGQTSVTISCKNCTTGFFNGNPSSNNNCYDNVTNVPSTSITAEANVYCSTLFTFSDGMPTAIDRRPNSGNVDPDLKTTGIPNTPGCVYNHTAPDVLDCTYVCTTDNCNTITLDSLMSCVVDCGTNGYCNYFTGSCTCNDGYSGSSCATIDTVTYRSCVQCNEDIDSGCPTKTAGTQCAINSTASNVFCITRKTTLLDASGSVVRSRITRSCTAANGVQDQCTFSDPADPMYSGFTEETCTSTCETDNCNTGTPDGALAASETSSLYCVQCTGMGPNNGCYAATARTLCPNTANQCYSKIVYYHNARSDLRNNADPAIRYASIERSCRQSSNSVNSCTNETLTGTNSLKVTCEESCTTDGCNDDWPSRPKCSQCMSSRNIHSNDTSYDRCLLNPPNATKCNSPAEIYCVRIQQASENNFLSSLLSVGGSNGYSHKVTRTCAFQDHGNSCNTSFIVGDVKVMECNKTCTEDNCNQGNGSIAPASQSTVMFPLLAFLARLLQQLSQ